MLAQSEERINTRLNKVALVRYDVTTYGFLDTQFPRVLIDTGPVGLAVFVWLIRPLFVIARKTYRRASDPLFRALSLVFWQDLFGMLGHSVGCNTFIIVGIMEPFSFLAAMIVKIPEIQGAKAVTVPEEAAI